MLYHTPRPSALDHYRSFSAPHTRKIFYIDFYIDPPFPPRARFFIPTRRRGGCCVFRFSPARPESAFFSRTKQTAFRSRPHPRADSRNPSKAHILRPSVLTRNVFSSVFFPTNPAQLPTPCLRSRQTAHKNRPIKPPVKNDMENDIKNGEPRRFPIKKIRLGVTKPNRYSEKIVRHTKK